MAATIMVCIGAAGLVASLWILICNDITARQRRKLVDFVFEGKDYLQKVELYRQVSYDRHMWSLMMFRSPRKLYHRDLWPAFA